MKSDKRPVAVTMEDVARRAGVSRALVSIVFRDVPGASVATRERVMRAADQLGYRPDARARLLGSNRSQTIGVVFTLQHEFHAELIDEMYGAVDASGFDLALGAATPRHDEERAVQSLLGYRCEAFVLIGPSLSTGAIEALARQVPVVVVARALRSPVVDVVRTDDAAGGRLAVDHLAALGHRRIAHVDGRRAPGAAERRRGYRKAMDALGLGSRDLTVPGGLTEEHGETAAKALMRGRHRPTAVAAFNDHCAVGLMAAARANGVRVPEDLSVVGYDDSHVAALSAVSLTTVAQDARTLATSALDLALARVAEPTRERSEVVVPPRLVVRSTTQAR
jgi:DNA-binding LacI/PurR family transcriptional regulator